MTAKGIFETDTNRIKARLLFSCLLALSIILTGILWPFADASANERMAGGKKQKASPAAAAAVEKNTFTTDAGGSHYRSLPLRDIIYIESQGLVKRHDEAIIGSDMWRGSSYDDIYRLVSHLPVKSGLPPLYDLQKFILTMGADAGLLDRNGNEGRNENGSTQTDLFTLRIEKLLEMGAFKDAVALYSKSILPPHNRRLAEAAILSLLYTGQTAQACLEQRLLRNEPDNEKNKAFWMTLDDFCAITLSAKPVRKTQGAADGKDSDTLTDSISGTAMAALSYRFTPESIDDLTARSVLEKAILFGIRKIDYSRMRLIENPENIALADLAALLADPNLPPQHRYILLPYGISTALIEKSGIKTVYENTELPVDFETVRMSVLDDTLSSLPEWQKIPFLHQLLRRISTPASRLEILEKALHSTKKEDLAYLLPFATPLAEAGLENISGESLDKAASLLFIALEKNEIDGIGWKNIAQQHLQINGPIACFPENKNITEASAENDDNSANSGRYNEDGLMALCRIMFKLDKRSKLHNYGRDESYEKPSGLTFDGDYVMPLGDLTERLDEAVRNNRHGEIVLSGILVFPGNGAGKDIPPALLEKTADALSTVGLIDVSRAIVRIAIAGYDEQK